MSDYTRGLLTLPAALLALALLAALLFGALWLVGHVWPAHWSLRGPQRRSADVQRLFRRVNAAGRYMDSFRRLVALGPWTLYVARYRAGRVDDVSGERIP